VAPRINRCGNQRSIVQRFRLRLVERNRAPGGFVTAVASGSASRFPAIVGLAAVAFGLLPIIYASIGSAPPPVVASFPPAAMVYPGSIVVRAGQ
jgi:hypothetical protein